KPAAAWPDTAARRSRRLARRDDAAPYPRHPAQLHELRARADTAIARRVRTGLAGGPAADDNRLCELRRRRRPRGGGEPRLAVAGDRRRRRAHRVYSAA